MFDNVSRENRECMGCMGCMGCMDCIGGFGGTIWINGIENRKAESGKLSCRRRNILYALYTIRTP